MYKSRCGNIYNLEKQFNMKTALRATLLQWTLIASAMHNKNWRKEKKLVIPDNWVERLNKSVLLSLISLLTELVSSISHASYYLWQSATILTFTATYWFFFFMYYYSKWIKSYNVVELYMIPSAPPCLSLLSSLCSDLSVIARLAIGRNPTLLLDRQKIHNVFFFFTSLLYLFTGPLSVPIAWGAHESI